MSNDKKPWAGATSGYTKTSDILINSGKLVSSHSKVIWNVLACMERDGKAVCTPSLNRLCQLSGLSQGEVSKCLNELETKGCIERKRRGLGLPNEYTVLMPTWERLETPFEKPKRSQILAMTKSTG